MNGASESLYRSTDLDVDEVLSRMDFSCFSLPASPNFDHSDFLVSSSMDRIMSGDDMTVLVGAVSETGQVVIASDSMQWDSDGNSSTGLWKTLRINALCAIGFSGHTTYAGRIAAILMNRPKLVDRDGDILKLIEESGIQQDQWKTVDGVRAILGGVLECIPAHIKLEYGNLPNVVLAGKDESGVHLSQWLPPAEDTPFWRASSFRETVPREAHALVFGPGKIKGCKCPKRIIKKTKTPFTDRVLAICELYAEQFPDKVNRDFWMRSNVSSFARHPLSAR